jgi:hypothetical protein
VSQRSSFPNASPSVGTSVNPSSSTFKEELGLPDGLTECQALEDELLGLKQLLIVPKIR